jgi:hypothetical protein
MFILDKFRSPSKFKSTPEGIVIIPVQLPYVDKKLVEEIVELTVQSAFND